MRATSNCRLCNAPVAWARTAFNKTPLPIDPEPAAEGNIIVDVQCAGAGQTRLVATVLPPGHGGEETRYTSHFDTCQGETSGQWRRRTHA